MSSELANATIASGGIEAYNCNMLVSILKRTLAENREKRYRERE